MTFYLRTRDLNQSYSGELGLYWVSLKFNAIGINLFLQGRKAIDNVDHEEINLGCEARWKAIQLIAFQTLWILSRGFEFFLIFVFVFLKLKMSKQSSLANLI